MPGVTSPSSERADRPRERRQEDDGGEHADERDRDPAVLPQFGAEGLPDAPVHGDHDGEERHRREQRKDHVVAITGPTRPETTCAAGVGRGETKPGPMRAVFVAIWLIIVFGIAFYAVVGAGGF